MALKNLFDMVKADRYTADGREAIIKAQEEETEDKVYQIGEISQKTGLQKTANGWVKPKNGKQPKAKKDDGSIAAAERNMDVNEHVKYLEQDLKQAQKTKAGPDKEFNIKYKILETLAGGTDSAFETFKEAFKKTNNREQALEQALNKYNYSQKKTEKQPGAKSNPAAESKPAAQEVKLGGGADTYYFEDPDNMSNEDKVFKSLDIELDSSFGDRDGNPDDVESWVEAWKENIRNEGGIGIKSKKTRQPAAPVPAEEALKIIEKNPARLKNLIKRAKKFYSGGTIVGGFDDWGGRAIGEDSAPCNLTGDTKIRVRKA